jgi:DNA-binding GntR family transcriptional regulator
MIAKQQRSQTWVRRMKDPQKSVVENLFDQIRSQIAEGRFAPGQRLIEPDLTERFGISRGPLREAIRRLAAEGLVEITHNRGARVKRLDRDEVVALYEVREPMEGLAAKLATERANASERREIESIFKEMGAALKSRDTRSYIALNSRFHNAILAAARNAPLEDAITRLQTPVLRVQFEALMTLDVVEESHDEHRAITGAIIGKNADEAERLMRHHIRRSREMISRRPASEFG